MNKIRCSILIPAYNAAEHVEECLRSVVNHTTSYGYEIIVIDDGSTDATAEIVSRKFPQVRLLKKTNGGPGSARNLGASHAVSDILVFIDADDVMLEGRLDHQVGYMLQHPEVGLTFGNRKYEVSPEIDGNLQHGWAHGDDFEIVGDAYQRLLAKGPSISTTVVTVRKKAYLEIGGQPEQVYVCEDYAMCCDIARRWPIAASCRKLTWYRQSGAGNLMDSAYTYEGHPRVLYEQLAKSADLISKEVRVVAQARLVGLVDVLIRHKWIYAKRRGALDVLSQYRDILPARFALKWKLITVVPSAVPRLLRCIKHRGHLPHHDT